MPKPNQTKPNQTKPNQTKPNQTKPNQTKPNQAKKYNPRLYKKQLLSCFIAGVLGLSVSHLVLAADGLVDLGVLNNGGASQAYGVNADGSVVVGYARDGDANNKIRAFRWTDATGMQSLGVLNGGDYSVPKMSMPMAVWWWDRLAMVMPIMT